MKLRHILLTLAAAAVLAVPATAQEARYREADDERLVVQPFNLTVDQVDDMKLHARNGEEIGEIDEVLVDATGRAVAVSVEVGGFLGIGEQEVVVPIEQLRLQEGRFVSDYSKAQIEALPRWDD
jgi:hypothetical protein